jgi:uncharacterized membrane protein
MAETLFKWLRKYYNIFVHSIGLVPAVLGLGFLLLAIGTMELDALGLGSKLNQQFKWLTLRDAETARTIVSTVAGGIISLTVFSFSMVMILMNQAASQMSNRMLDNIIGDKTQKLILSFYVGTIVFALFLLTNISEAQKEISVPAISVYFLLLLTIIDIFLFIYFLHYITQSFRYEQLIQRIHQRTTGSLATLDRNKNADYSSPNNTGGCEILSQESGYYQGFDEKRLLKFAEIHDIVIRFLHPIGTYLLKGTPFFTISRAVEKDELAKILLNTDFYYGQEIDKNAYYGFYHLTEVAVKALSPGINDPGTAVLSIHALTDLFSRLIKQPIAGEIKDSRGKLRIVTKQLSIEELFDCTVLSVWDYGKNDRLVKQALIRMIRQLMFIDEQNTYKSLFADRLKTVEAG